MSLSPLSPTNYDAFRAVCAAERLYGSRSLCAHQAGTAESFYLDASTPAALSLAGGVLTVVSPGLPELEPLVDFILAHSEIGEVDSTLTLCAALRQRLGGELESSFFMACAAPLLPEPDPRLEVVPAPPLEVVFDLLQRSHPYYQTHLQFAPWSGELSRWLELGLSELYGLKADGQWVGTGRIISQDDAAGAIGAVAVVPEFRHRGYGRQMSAFLTRRVMELDKEPVLISGYDAVAALYRSIGFVEMGRWGELYLNRCR